MNKEYVISLTLRSTKRKPIEVVREWLLSELDNIDNHDDAGKMKGVQWHMSNVNTLYTGLRQVVGLERANEGRTRKVTK